jgi:hypothetical protein
MDPDLDPKLQIILDLTSFASESRKLQKKNNENAFHMLGRSTTATLYIPGLKSLKKSSPPYIPYISGTHWTT